MDTLDWAEQGWGRHDTVQPSAASAETLLSFLLPGMRSTWVPGKLLLPISYQGHCLRLLVINEDGHDVQEHCLHWKGRCHSWRMSLAPTAAPWPHGADRWSVALAYLEVGWFRVAWRALAAGRLGACPPVACPARLVPALAVLFVTTERKVHPH